MSVIDPPPTRIVDGVEVPAVGTWVIDPAQTEVSFIGRRFMLTRVRGRFSDVAGAVRVADDPAESAVVVELGMASLSSGSTDRDEHLRSPALFDVERFPRASFASTSVSVVGRRARVRGDLTIVGVTRAIVLEVDYRGAVRDPWGGQRAVFSMSTELNREDWGLSWNVALDSGGVMVSKRIRIEAEVETLRSADARD